MGPEAFRDIPVGIGDQAYINNIVSYMIFKKKPNIILCETIENIFKHY